MGNTFELKCGITLELQPVSADAIRNLIADSELEPVISQWDKLVEPNAARQLERSLDAKTMLAVNRSTTRLFNYCLGFGVVSPQPPPNELNELRSMGFDVSTPRIALVNWLRYLKLADTDEAGTLVGTIMALSIQPVEDEPTEVDALRARIAELEAQRQEQDGSGGTGA